MRSGFLLLLLLLIGQPLWALKVPELNGRVNDRANVLGPSTEQNIEQFLAKHENETSNQIAVLTLSSLKGESLEGYANRVFNTWQLGQRDKNNGILVLVAMKERAIRIEVGYGLEGALTDLLAGRIIRDEMAPQFKQGRPDQGIVNGLNAIAGVIAGEYTPSGSRSLSIGQWFVIGEKMFLPAVGALILIMILLVLGLGRLIAFGSRWWKRNMTFKTGPKTGQKLFLLSEEEEDQHLTKGQQMEETLNTLQYEVWSSKSGDEVLVVPTIGSKTNNRPIKCSHCNHYTAVYKVSYDFPKEHKDHKKFKTKSYKCEVCGGITDRRVRIRKVSRDAVSGRPVHTHKNRRLRRNIWDTGNDSSWGNSWGSGWSSGSGSGSSWSSGSFSSGSSFSGGGGSSGGGGASGGW